MLPTTELDLMQVQDVLEQLEQAVWHHNQWLMDWHRAIICKVPLDQKHMMDNAYRHCEFGEWYYSKKDSFLNKFEEFEKIEFLHITMHTIARLLILKTIENEFLSLVEYDAFLKWRTEFRETIVMLEKKLRQILLYTDPLTRIANRHQMIPTLYKYRDQKRDIVVCMSDLDHFKKINDTYGHTIGDYVLTAVAKFLVNHLRPLDIIFRYGGEEFLILLTDIDLEICINVVDRLRSVLAKHMISIDPHTSLCVTASFGLVQLDHAIDVEEIIAQADQALYTAKETGRNRVCYKIDQGIQCINLKTE